MNSLMQKHEMTEEDIKLQYITPAIEQAGWNKHTQIKMEYFFTDGRVIVNGKVTARGERKKADYILYYQRNLPLAIVEAKDNKHPLGAGMQQAIEYAKILDIPFVYTSNGDGFLEHDMKCGTERNISRDEFPSPSKLWSRHKGDVDITAEQERIITEPYYFKQGEKHPRYYQQVAINRAISAIAKGQNRLLLVMATGTGKTYTAFQIIHRLWKSRMKRKILFLADRNILVDQTMQQDFKPFEKVMTKVGGHELNSSYEIFLSLYQQLVGTDGEEHFRTLSPDFFDLIIIDECHRGSANDDSTWRKILEYFNCATQIGMTATPRETNEISNITYFGEPIYKYTLKQGIEDGFLAPYKVIRIGLDKDWEGFRPIKGQLDDNGNEIEDREYGLSDYDRKIVLVKRTNCVAERITKWLKENGRMSKAIIFCTGVNHAERMRQALVNLNSDLVAKDSRYVMRITGDDPQGKKQLDNFIDIESPYPVLATTSKLLSTGVDCKTCKLIVLDSNIQSMTEFKQIIGRGSRLCWDDDKKFFTIMDFRNVTRLFADTDFDGEPVVVMEERGDCGQIPCECTCAQCGKRPCECEPTQLQPCPICGHCPCSCPKPPPPPPPPSPPNISNVDVRILDELVRYYDKDGKLTIESIKSFRDGIRGEFSTLDEFINAWNSELHKQVIFDEFKERGILLEALRKEVGNQDIDDFDLICHLAFDKKPLTKSERINNVKKRNYLTKYEGLAREVLTALLDKYGETGIADLGDLQILCNDPFRRLGTATNIVNAFGGREAFIIALKELQSALYADVA